jgi:hypothetical protein
MIKKIFIGVVLFLIIYIYSYIQRAKVPTRSTTAKLVVTSTVTETNVISDSEWFTVEYPLLVELLPEYKHLQILLLINDDTNRLHIVPSDSGTNVSYGNGARFGRIVLRPGQGPWKQAKVRTTRAIVE